MVPTQPNPNVMLVAFCDPPGSEPVVYGLAGWQPCRDQLDAARRDFFASHPVALEYQARADRCDALAHEAPALRARMPELRRRWQAAVRTEPAAAVEAIGAEIEAAERRAADVAGQLAYAAAERDVAKATAEVILNALLAAAGAGFMQSSVESVPPAHAAHVHDIVVTEFRLMSRIGGLDDEMYARRQASQVPRP
ncbi:unnamed protein product [Gemmataceae bacterium]|nr:unnamed protein product [Gemmataceae bacterium]VTT97596.1 unnamed protein product [Gemmataceae bacterium]